MSQLTEKVSDAALTAYVQAFDAADPAIGRRTEYLRPGLEAMLTVAAAEIRARIAYDIRAELVCCDVYERDAGTERAGRTHPICFWGEAAARIAVDTEPSAEHHARMEADRG